MKVIIPMAGYGTRLRPHTYSRPKPLVNVAGQPLLKHVIESLDDLDIDQWIFIVGYLGQQIEDYIDQEYDIDAVFLEQKEMRGQSHAIRLTDDYLDGPAVILFSDTIFNADLTPIKEAGADGVIYTMEVDDPRSFGVVQKDEDGIIQQFVEKPDTDEFKEAVIGLYYVQDSRALMDAIEWQINQDKTKGNEYYIADALQRMVDQGHDFRTSTVNFWLDCGTPETLLATNRFLLEHNASNTEQVNGDGNTIVPPVYIHPSATIERSVIGPHATISAGCTVRDSIVRNSVIDQNATVDTTTLEESLIGRRARVQGRFTRLNVGDESSLELE